MIVHVFENAAQVARAAAALFTAQILKKPDSVLGLATGSTPIDTYQELIRLHKDGILDFSRVTTFNLDEYVGLPADHEQSYDYFMRQQLFSHINIKSTHLPSGIAPDMTQECRDYEELIKQAGGIDLQLLGIGNNGHIGFNEPADAFPYNTNITSLADSTIKANRRFFTSEDEVPKTAISMGIGTIMEARSILLLAMGEGKADAILQMVEGPITPRLPASILRSHPSVTVLLDKAAASKLSC
ncbi:MAG: glucosamine-6-phosphate deaminase [Christensenellales bacterium]|jgi:glucosamine-6-phosphate deaminase|nr:glucosamine-6-phosphate deaminase [Clostridiales bacterium]